MIDPILEVNKLVWNVEDKKILDILDMKLYPGERVALIGPNGSGKSSLLKILAYLQKPTSGEVLLHSTTSKSLIDKRRTMAVVFQEPLLLKMSVYDNVAYGLKIRKFKGNIKEKVAYWLKMLKIDHLKHRYPQNLSGGEAQRVSIARAMALEPKILFLDEPFSALDAPTKSQLLEDLSVLIKSMNMTSVFITHDFSEIPFLADKVFVLHQGKIMQEGSLEDVFYRPKTVEVANLVGADNQIEGFIVETTNNVGRLSINENIVLEFENVNKLSAKASVIAIIRSEDVELGSGPHNVFEGKVEKISVYGLQYKVLLNCGFPINLLLDKKEFISLKPDIGDILKINIPRDRIQIIT